MTVQAEPRFDEAYAVAARVEDPELPFMTIEELGILRSVVKRGDSVVAHVAPTYLGCPAVSVIEQAVLDALTAAGYKASVEAQLTPAWTTDWISEAGRQKLLEHGVVMEKPVVVDGVIPLFTQPPPVQCPHCGSEKTKLVSKFGSTPCKSQYQCEQCQEPFELFKCH